MSTTSDEHLPRSPLRVRQGQTLAKSLGVFGNAVGRRDEDHLPGAIEDCHIVMAGPHARALIETDEKVRNIGPVHNENVLAMLVDLVHHRNGELHQSGM